MGALRERERLAWKNKAKVRLSSAFGSSALHERAQTQDDMGFSMQSRRGRAAMTKQQCQRVKLNTVAWPRHPFTVGPGGQGL